MYKRVLFDIDGTILDTKKASLLAMRDALRDLSGRECAPEDLEYSFGIPTMEVARRCGFPARAYIDAVDPYYASYGEKYNRVFPGIRELLDALFARKIPMGIVTAKTRWEYDHDFDRYALKRYFPVSMTVDDTARPKPAPDPIEKYAALTGANKNDILFIGDTRCDYECARDAGVAFAFAKWSGNRAIGGADYAPASPADILALV